MIIRIKSILTVLILGVVLQSNARSVKEFGAIGDGKTDDTTAIQDAVKRAGGLIQFPPGAYRLTRPIIIDLQKTGFVSLIGNGIARIIMEGSGPAFRFIGTHQGTADPKTVNPKIWDHERMPTVHGLEIIGKNKEACGIEAIGTMQLTIRQTNIRECLHGIQLVKRNRNVIISDCHLYNNHGIGVFLDHVNLHQFNIANSHISYNDGGGIVVRGGNVRNIHISNCDIEANMSANAPPTANVFFDNQDGSIGEAAITGCTIQHSHDAPDSANIRIFALGPPRSGDQPVRDGNITISGNVLSDVRFNIHLRQVRGVTITGNTMWKAYDRNVLVEDCTHVVLGSNVYDRNPRYGYGDGNDAKLGLAFRNSSSCILSGEHIVGTHSSGGGLVLQNCREFNISGCSFLNCREAGIRLENVTDSLITDCIIRNDQADTNYQPVISINSSDNLINNLLIRTRKQLDGQLIKQ